MTVTAIKLFIIVRRINKVSSIETSLVISGRKLDKERISSILAINSTKFRDYSGFPQISKDMGLAHDEWIFSIYCENAKSISSEMSKLRDVFSNQIEMLNEICTLFNAEISIVFVVKYDLQNNPELCFSKEDIHFASSIDADIGFDFYVLD